MNDADVLILVFAADPCSSESGSPLRLDEDVRAIREKSRAGKFRDAFKSDVRWARRADDMIHALNETRPQVVHFSGHGGKGGLILVGEDRFPQQVSVTSLARLFGTLGDGVRVVVLSACYSRTQAEAIVESVDCVIGTPGPLPDSAALIFNSSFYRALAFGRSVREAFDQASVAVSLAGYPNASCQNC